MADLDAIHENDRFPHTISPHVILLLNFNKHVQIVDICCCFFCRMGRMVEFGMDWKYGELEQIVYIPVTQIVEEITELNIPVTQIMEEITELNIPVPQIVEEIAEVSKSSIEWRSIPNVYIDGIRVFLG